MSLKMNQQSHIEKEGEGQRVDKQDTHTMQKQKHNNNSSYDDDSSRKTCRKEKTRKTTSGNVERESGVNVDK